MKESGHFQNKKEGGEKREVKLLLIGIGAPPSPALGFTLYNSNSEGCFVR